MKGRETKGPPSADLLVCFPSRAHLSLMAPKTICSPSRPNEPNKRHHHNRQSHLKRSTTRRGGGGAYASPLLWAKTKPMGSEISEPTSPKVTCAGQIKVRSKPNSSCKNWQSVMEEIERLHNSREQKKKSSWSEALGFKKDAMQFLTCLRNIKFDFQCFGSFPASALSSDDEDDDDEEEEDDCREINEIGLEEEEKDDTSTPVFSKWFMVLQEEQSNRLKITEHETEDRTSKEEPIIGSCVPPPNALLLMRCRSAPAKSWLEERDEEDKMRETEDDEEEKKTESAMEEEIKKSNSLAMLMRYDADFYKLSCDIAKETWVVGGVGEQFSRSRSWKK